MVAKTDCKSHIIVPAHTKLPWHLVVICYSETTKTHLIFFLKVFKFFEFVLFFFLEVSSPLGCI